MTKDHRRNGHEVTGWRLEIVVFLSKISRLRFPAYGFKFMEVRNEDGKILSTHESLSKLFSTVRTILILNDHSLLRRTADLFFLCFLHIFSIHPYFLHLENFQVCLGQLRTMSRIFIIWLTTFTSILS